jgi:hypothetical protein
MSAPILNLETRKCQPHAPASLLPEKEPANRRLGGTQSRYGSDGEERNPCPCWESNPGLSARSLVTIRNVITGAHKLDIFSAYTFHLKNFRYS